jgi:hypothetical protein
MVKKMRNRAATASAVGLFALALVVMARGEDRPSKPSLPKLKPASVPFAVDDVASFDGPTPPPTLSKIEPKPEGKPAPKPLAKKSVEDAAPKDKPTNAPAPTVSKLEPLDLAEPRAMPTDLGEELPSKSRQTANSNPLDDATTALSAAPQAGVRARPTVEVKQTMPEEIRIGEPFPVTMTIVNNGPVVAEQVVLTSNLPAEVEMLSAAPLPARNANTLIWPLGDLEPEQQRQIKLKLSLKAGIDAAALKIASRVRTETSLTTSAAIYQPKLVVELSAPSAAVVNGRSRVEIKVTNAGNTPARRVTLRAPLPVELSHPFGQELENEIGELKPGESRRIPLTVTAVKAGKTNAQFQIAADGVTPVAKDWSLEIRQVQLTLAAKAAKARYLNRPTEFQFAVANKGEVDAGDAKLVANLPRGVSYVHANGSGVYDAGKHQVVWSVGKLKPGEERELVLTGVAAEIGDQACRAVLSANGVEHESTCSTVVQGVAAMQVEVIDTADPLELGGVTIYSVRLVNQGTAKQTNIRVACQCSAEIKPIDTRAPSKHAIHEQNLTFEPIAEMAPKDSLIFKIKAKGAKPGDAKFRVEVSSDQQTTPISKDETTKVYGDEG